MGVMAYGKSFSNNYLEQRRVNNFDRSTYMYVQGNFPAIVTEEEWHRVQEIKARRIKNSFSPNAKVPRHGTKENRDLWGSRLECSCGCSFRRNIWHRYVDAPTTYGYQCYNILNNGSAKHRRDAGADDTGYCDQPMIADWKLELMAKKVLEQVFREKRDLIDYTCQLIRDSYRSPKVAETNLPNILARIERLNAKKEMLLDMRAEGEITKEEYLHQKQKLETELLALMAEKDKLSKETAAEPEMPQWGKIQNALSQVLDLSQPKPDPDLVRKFVSKIVPDGKNTFHWYLNLDGNSAIIQTVMVEGRKNQATVTVGVEDASSVTATVIHIMALLAMAQEEKTCLLGQLHRPLSRMAGIK
jgi:hypothetical protein